MNFITIDLGGTNTRIAHATGLDQPTFDEAPIRRKNTHTYEDDISFIIEAARSFSGGKPIDALGIGVPGRVDDQKLDMVASNNLPEWAGRNFAVDLSKALDCPVYIDNDGIAAGIGESYFGAISSDFHYLIWGTGISSVSIKHMDDGRLTAAYIRPDHHDHFQNWENDCGGAGLERKYGKPGEQLTKTEWDEVNGIFTQYLKEYILAARPSAIVFGGGLAIHHSATIANLEAVLDVPIHLTEFGENSGLVGGLGLIRHNLAAAKTAGR